MALTKTQLIGEIYKAFEGVTLEDGVGLWEGLALDDRLEGTKEYERLKAKDERKDWQNISVLCLYKCSTSISFFDAKGMRFHLGLHLLFGLDVFMDEEDRLHQDKSFRLWPPEIEFALTHKLESDYSKKRFSLLSAAQIECVINFLEHLLGEKNCCLQKIDTKQKVSLEAYCKELEEAIALWKIKALVQ